MTLKFILAKCKVYDYAAKDTKNMVMPFKNERTLKANIREQGCMLLECEKVVETFELTNSQAISLYHACVNENNKNTNKTEVE